MTRDPTRTVWQRMSEQALARVGKNAVALLAAQAGAKLLNLALTAQLARTLGVAALGRYLWALTVESIALAVADLGINVYTVRELARASAHEPARGHKTPNAGPIFVQEPEEDDSSPQALWSAALSLKLLAALCCTLVLNLVVATLSFPSERRALIAVASLALLPDAFSGVATALVKARQRMEISSAINLATRLLAAIGGILLLRLEKSERAVLLSYVAASWVGSCAFIGALWSWHIQIRLSRLWRRWRTVLRESVPFAITGIVAILYSRVDLLMLAHWQGDQAAGLYGAAARVWEALGMIPASLLDALFPELSRVSAAQNRAHMRTLYRQGQMLVWSLVGIVGVPCFVLAPQLIALLYGQSADTTTAASILRALLFAFPFTYLYLLDGHLLYANGQQRWVTGAMIAATAANGLLNAIVIPRWSYQGAVGVAILTQMLLYALLRGGAWQRVWRPSGDPGQMPWKERL